MLGEIKRRTYIYISVILLTNVLLLLVAYDSDEWYGLDETNDDTFIKKVILRGLSGHCSLAEDFQFQISSIPSIWAQ